MKPLQIQHGATIARVVADLGFNCYSLTIDGFDYLHHEPDVLDGGSPTRSGIPILFPWPNRIAGSRYWWDGVEYEVPVTQPATGASLHGFACRTPWRVISHTDDSITGEWILSRDAPQMSAMWPADAGIRVTYQVAQTSLTVSSEVFTADDRDLPFGLGFHPYFRVPGPFEQWLLQCDADQFWPLADMTPSGPAQPVPDDLDFRRARRTGDQHLDDVLTGLPEAAGMTRRAALLSMASSLTVSTDPGFREFVLFTPAGRAAVAIEPYTCTTNAVNLQASGIDAGWRVLPAGQRATYTWRIDVE